MGDAGCNLDDPDMVSLGDVGELHSSHLREDHLLNGARKPHRCGFRKPLDRTPIHDQGSS